MPAHQIHAGESTPGLAGNTTMELGDMTSRWPSGQRIRATEADVAAWFREAWPGRKDYPNDVRNWAVARRLNIIVDRANARSERDHSTDALRERREHYRVALKYARALQKALPPIKEHLLSVKGMLRGPEGVELLYRPLAEEIAALKEIEHALDAFLTRCESPSLDDHEDEIVWIRGVAQKAWADTLADHPENEENMPPLGLGPEGRLTGFVQSVLKGIGFGSEGRRGNSRETISDHLRGRQNRKRDRKKSKE